MPVEEQVDVELFNGTKTYIRILDIMNNILILKSCRSPDQIHCPNSMNNQPGARGLVIADGRFNLLAVVCVGM